MNSNIIVNNTDLFVTGEIGYDFLAEDFIKQINSLPKGETINVHIYSGGGSLFDALAIYDFIKLKGIKFDAYLSGLCGSAATIISASAENTYIGANSSFFVHRAFFPYGVETEEQQASLDNINERLISIYQKLTGLSKPAIKKILDKGDNGYFMGSNEAIDLGFVHSTFKENQLAANFNFHKEYKPINNNMNKPEFNADEFKNGIVTDVINSIKDLFAKKEKEVSNEALEISVQNEVNNRVDDVVNTYEEKIKEVTTAKVDIENSLNAKITELETEIAGLKVIPIDVNNLVIDPSPTENKPKEVSVWDSVANQFDNFLK
jgi:ATP-dependent protease ClpP protease subunit